MNRYPYDRFPSESLSGRRVVIPQAGGMRPIRPVSAPRPAMPQQMQRPEAPSSQPSPQTIQQSQARMFAQVPAAAAAAAAPLPEDVPVQNIIPPTAEQEPSMPEMPPQESTGDLCPMLLAIAYVKNQPFEALYTPEEGLMRGTIFSGLDLPYEGGENA